MVPARRCASAWRTTALALLLAFAGACDDDASGPGDDFTDARRRWLATRPTSYELRTSVSCFCPLPPQPVTLHVRGDSIVSAVDARGAAVSSQIAGLYRTVDGLFALIAEARARRAAELRTTYDAERGYPTSIAVDYATQVADDEYWYETSGFVAR